MASRLPFYTRTHLFSALDLVLRWTVRMKPAAMVSVSGKGVRGVVCWRRENGQREKLGMAKFEGSGSRVSGFRGWGQQRKWRRKRKTRGRVGGCLSKPVQVNRAGPVYFWTGLVSLIFLFFGRFFIALVRFFNLQFFSSIFPCIFRHFNPIFSFIQNLQNKIKLIKNPKNSIKTSIKLVKKYLKNIIFLAQTNTPTPRFCSSSSKIN